MDVTREGHRDAPLILIVDDEADIADMLESYFRLEGYRTLVARDAAGAIEAAGRAPDAILLDVNLPDADGFSVCRTIRELVACPIIFLTARVEDADAIAGFAAGGDDYVTKPFSLEVLGARVRAQLAREHRRLDRATVRFPGGIVVDFARREVRVATDGGGHGERVATLARKDFDIVANAARYARSEVGVSLSWADGELELIVTDDGPGFRDVALKRAAEPFWGESKGAGGHLGLGLYVARLLAEKHGGSLELARAEGGGALVRVRVSAPETPAVAHGAPDA